jgi:hypothetical protein
VAIARVAEAGAVGGSIEDYDRETGLYPVEQAAERVAAAAEAARAFDWPFVLTARAENHIRGNPDLDDTIARLQAFEAVGADVLYAPGLRTAAEIRAVCDAVGKPVNVLAHAGLSLAEVVARATSRRSWRGRRWTSGSGPDRLSRVRKGGWSASGALSTMNRCSAASASRTSSSSGRPTSSSRPA